MGEIAFADVFRTKLDLADLIIPDLAGDRTDLERVAGNRNDIEIVKINGIASVRDDRADIAGEKIFIFANAEHERRAATGTNHEILDVGMNQSDAVSADHLF